MPSKAEPRSAAFFRYIDSESLSKSQPEDPLLGPGSKAITTIMVAETGYLLSQETVISSWHRGLVRGHWRKLEDSLTVNDPGETEKSPLKTYWDLTSELEDFTLYRLHLTHKLVKNRWTKCQRENIVRIFQRPSPIREGPQWERILCVKVVLHVRHQRPSTINRKCQNGTITWSTLYSHHLEEINADPIDILGLPIDDAESEIIDEKEDDLITEDDEQEEYRFDWMLLAEMGPSPNADTFVNRISRIDDEEESIIVNYQTLNNNQKILFKRIESHYHDALARRKVEPLRIIVMGTAGTGKTYLIKAIRCRLQKMVGTGSKSPMVVLAPTGVAAFNIDRTTIHSGLAIPIINDSKRLEIKGERLKQLQDKLRDVSYVIIDEKSMIGRQMLALIDMRLRQAFSEHNNKPFGGRSVIMFSDFGQLPPVLDLPMYANTKRDALSNSGLAVYKKFGEVYKLETIQRQSGNSKEQQEFRNILLRMRNGESTIDDWKILTTRIEDKIGITDRNSFSDALVLLTK
ncbi:unnamed protein product [Rhizophagus irregularis]|nr:unnamed protein product [Rhizophagus irregularis]